MSSPNISPFFDSKTHNVILQSSDDLSFHLDKSSLSAHSSVFRGMFTLPEKDGEAEEVQTVKMAEDGTTLELLFRFTLLNHGPTLGDFDLVVGALSLCDKYGFHAPILKLLDQMFAFVESRPIEVWAYCNIYGVEGIARFALCSFDTQSILTTNFYHRAHPDKPSTTWSQTRPVSPSDLPADLLARVPILSLRRLLVCYDLVAMEGRTWLEVAKDY